MGTTSGSAFLPDRLNDLWPFRSDGWALNQASQDCDPPPARRQAQCV